MSASGLAISHPDAAPPPAGAAPHEVQQAADAQRYRAILHTLIDQAAAIATRLAATATAATTPDSALPEAAVAFERIARTVRHTIALARQVATQPAPRSAPKPSNPHARTQLIRGVEDAIHRKRRDCDTEALTREFQERLEDPELELDLEGRTVEDLIEEISRDLGVAQQGRSWVWQRRTPADVRTLQARAAATAARPPVVRPPEACRSDTPRGTVATQDTSAKAAGAAPGSPPLHPAGTAMSHATIEPRTPQIHDS